MTRLRIRVLNHINEHLGSQASRARHGLANGSKGRPAICGARNIVEAHDSDVIRDAQTGFLYGPHTGKRHGVGGGKDGIGLEWKQAFHGKVAACVREVSRDHKLLNKWHATLAERVAVALEAVPTG